ncbi:thiamine pyrophosphate-binding protein [Streptomyces sanglieri]|uniref:Thiamine pyrophosphate-binding protein n=1 Tax=Streptomyces sanglieri TaxID=193460 RepID=A0ABW2WZ08_9ACTN
MPRAFGIPGTHNLEIYRHLAAHRIEHLNPRHEQGAGYAADAYARVSGRPGVAITTTGPALLNIAAAVGQAYSDSVPLLVVSPGMPLHHPGSRPACCTRCAARPRRCGASRPSATGCPRSRRSAWRSPAPSPSSVRGAPAPYTSRSRWTCSPPRNRPGRYAPPRRPPPRRRIRTPSRRPPRRCARPPGPRSCSAAVRAAPPPSACGWPRSWAPPW